VGLAIVVFARQAKKYIFALERKRMDGGGTMLAGKKGEGVGKPTKHRCLGAGRKGLLIGNLE